METTIATVGLIACSFVGLFLSARTFLIVTTIFMALLAFGPVTYRYAETGDEGLIWEVAFRSSLFVVAAWGACALDRIYSRVVGHCRNPHDHS